MYHPPTPHSSYLVYVGEGQEEGQIQEEGEEVGDIVMEEGEEVGDIVMEEGEEEVEDIVMEGE